MLSQDRLGFNSSRFSSLNLFLEVVETRDGFRASLQTRLSLLMESGQKQQHQPGTTTTAAHPKYRPGIVVFVVYRIMLDLNAWSATFFHFTSSQALLREIPSPTPNSTNPCLIRNPEMHLQLHFGNNRRRGVWTCSSKRHSRRVFRPRLAGLCWHGRTKFSAEREQRLPTCHMCVGRNRWIGDGDDVAEPVHGEAQHRVNVVLPFIVVGFVRKRVNTLFSEKERKKLLRRKYVGWTARQHVQ